MAKNQRLSHRSKGQFQPSAWLEEGDGLIASAKVTRDLWKSYKREIPNAINTQGHEAGETHLDWNKLKGLPRASMLLLGYSVEMYLKVGLVKAYRGCSEEMFSRDIKSTFGHKLDKIAQEVCFCFDGDDHKNLNLLKDMVLIDARYPIQQIEGRSHSDVANSQTQKIWSEDNFNAFLNLANRVKNHTNTIDQDSNNPAYFVSFNIDKDGYLSFRQGGHLPPRITYRVSSDQKLEKKTSLEDIKSLFASDDFPELNHFWNQALIFEDGEGKNGNKKTIRHDQHAKNEGI